jgi:hypothetical protein
MKYQSVKLTPCADADVSKQKQREELQTELEKFLKQGGKVEKLKGTEFVPRPVRKKLTKKEKNASLTDVNKIRNWANAGGYNSGRRTQLPNATQISLKRVRSLLSPATVHGAKMTRDEFLLFSKAISKIESEEVSQGEAA